MSFEHLLRSAVAMPLYYYFPKINVQNFIPIGQTISEKFERYMEMGYI